MIERASRPRRARIALLGAASLWLACGQGANTGPAEIHWDRQACERCRMVISERRHAVQIRRTGESKTHAFDDLGCAVLWLDDQGSFDAGDPDVEIWVRRADGGGWTDARTARFEDGQSTPMAYGFATAEQGVALAVVQERLRTIERARRSHAPKASDTATRDGGADDE